MTVAGHTVLVTAAASNLLSSSLTALIILGVSAAIVFAGVCGAAWLRREPPGAPYSPVGDGLAPALIDDENARADAVTLAAHARRTYALAEQAAVTADRVRADRDALENEARIAWNAYDAASVRYEEARSRANAARQVPPMTIPDDEARQAVSHAAFTAFQRGDLSTAEFQTIWQQVGGHDPAQEQSDRDVEALAAETRQAHHAYKRLATALRAATERVHIAEVAERACLEEAAQAAREAQAAMTAVTGRAIR